MGMYNPTARTAGATRRILLSPRPDPRLLVAPDARSFEDGIDGRLFDTMGAHIMTVDGAEGAHFALWAPNAASVSVIGDFNRWNKEENRLTPSGRAGIWEGFAPGARKGDLYKYFIVSRNNGHHVEKTDPFSFLNEEPPRSASVVWDLDYRWDDGAWMTRRAERQAWNRPLTIYETHAGSWMRVPEEGNRWLTYRELAERLATYVGKMGFTHVELLPITEHPFYGSWGYQPTGFFAPTSRYGKPQDLMYLVDYLHRQGVGVILDWVPFHFPTDGHALVYFDGTHLYEHPDPRRGYHPVWRSAIFDYGRPEVRSFLLSSAIFWLEKYHMDGLRVDAVSYMLYLDYCRRHGQWIPNPNGGRENLDAVAFLHRLNRETHSKYPGVLTVAEEATSWPKVSRPDSDGGLGFDMKWDMGWMHDTLEYLHKPPHQRRHFLNKLTFRMIYAWSENFVLSLSHDEVVHLKGSLLTKMPGDIWQKFANLRLLYGYMYGLPGKKLLFMGGEFAQMREWNHNESLDWHLLQIGMHSGVQKCVADLNRLVQGHPALYELDFSPGGFEWIACDDHRNSVLTFMRKASGSRQMLVVCNFLPVVHREYRVGVPEAGHWREVLNTDAREYGGSGCGNLGGVRADSTGWNGRPYSLRLTLPPLCAMFFENSVEPVLE